ncbi:FAD:protein FMN transferase [Rhodospirillum centenum]|uniref:FAD:protein FMN transferase n=1 Tax=Rhodospirillum centenum (strain ATCC 51521 / SW) TaxID=414684 RepID=B6IP77_RHOCS|nr:FAD:protein FMN transferase [Rhodospirillum centenum]ACI99579.1 thiamine biosynthesis lipoprotein, putative [Rhodospirillum centenum SW]
MAGDLLATEARPLIPVALARGEARRPPPDSIRLALAGRTMGTDWSLRCHAPAGTDPAGVEAAVQAVFAGTIAEMSTWEPSSFICRFNGAPAGTTLEMPAGFRQVLAAALEVAAATDGAFDPCLAAEVNRRGFTPAPWVPPGAPGPQPPPHAPGGWRALAAVTGTGGGAGAGAERITQPGGLWLDLSAIAKGHAVDGMGHALRALGIECFLVEIGGEFVGAGIKPDLTPWWVALENPDGTPGGWRVALCGCALASSGDYRRRHVRDGRPVSHIVRRPGAADRYGDLASVSVVAADCMRADAWATALFAAGDADGLALADTHGIAALFQYRDAPPRWSAALGVMLE